MDHILISSIILFNIVLMQTHGLYAILGVPLKIKSLLFVGMSLTGLLVISQLLMYTIKGLLLADALYLELIIHVIVVFILFTGIYLILNSIHKEASQRFLTHAPWTIVHTLLIGTVVLDRIEDVLLSDHLLNTVGMSLGFIFVLVLFIAIQFRIQTYKIPKAMKGLPILLIIAGLMALAILGFAGIV
jgi:electron transport complex protein RnfA